MTSSRSPIRTILILYLLLALTEAIWLAPLLALVLPGADIFFAGGGIGFGMLLWTSANLCAAVTVTALLTPRSETLARIGLIVGILLALVLTVLLLPPEQTFFRAFPPALLSGLVVGGVWYAGASMASVTATITRAGVGLRTGIVGLLVGGIIPDQRVRLLVLWSLPIFFFVGLAGMALARAASLRSNREQYRASFGMGWVVFTMGLGGILSGLGFVLAAFLSSANFEPALSLVGDVLVLIVRFGAELLSPFFNAIQLLITQFRAQIEAGQGAPLPSSGVVRPQLPRGEGNLISSQWIVVILAVVLAAIVLMVIVLMVIRARARHFENAELGEERSDLATKRPSGAGLFGAGRDTLNEALASVLSLFRPDSTATTVRALYRRMVRLTTAAGSPRALWQTPDEYAPLVIQRFPEQRETILALTAAYVSVHYGELPDDPSILTQARQALDQMAEAGVTATQNSTPSKTTGAV